MRHFGLAVIGAGAVAEMSCSVGELRVEHGGVRGESGLDLASQFVGQYFVGVCLDAVQCLAFRFGVGPYKKLTEPEALSEFTARVENLRNEQRCRQQQLDQPAEQASPTSQPPA